MDSFRSLYLTAGNAINSIFNPPLAAEGIQPGKAPESSDDGVFRPTADEVVEVKQLLLESVKLPLELIDCIVDMAEYWPHTSSVLRRRTEDGAEDPLYVRAGDPNENQLLVSTPHFIKYPC